MIVVAVTVSDLSSRVSEPAHDWMNSRLILRGSPLPHSARALKQGLPPAAIRTFFRLPIRMGGSQCANIAWRRRRPGIAFAFIDRKESPTVSRRRKRIAKLPLLRREFGARTVLVRFCHDN